MALSDKEIKQAINDQLDKAEANFNKVRTKLFAANADLLKAELLLENKIETNIPGFETIEENKPEVANFIALILDIRESTKHLLQAISAKASQLERVLYETTAINTMGMLLVNDYNGSITEFLGDGFLALFKVEDIDKPKEVYKAHNCAKKCLRINSEIITDIIKERYSLPPLEIGIGLAFSPAIVTVIGFNDDLHPKAIGECIYRASKISKERNQIRIDAALERLWPASEDGILKFIDKDSRHGFDSYLLSKSK